MGHITENAMKQISDAFSRRLKESGVTRIQWIAMYYVQSKGPISQRELSYLMGVQDSSAGRLLDRLERDGWIVRTPNPFDRRMTMVSLTEEGDKMITELLPLGNQFNDDLIKGISESELLIFEKVLKRMILNVGEEDTGQL